LNMGLWGLFEFVYDLVFGKSCPPALQNEKHIVIIGGGYGGCQLASDLQRYKIPFTLVDPKDCFHHNVAACRAGVLPDQWNERQVIDYQKAFGDKFVRGKVTNVYFEDQVVVIDEKTEIKFTEVVFAVGSIGPFPGNSSRISSEDIKAQYVELSQAIMKSEKIVIIGGGPVGVEMAGEIVEVYFNKKIYLIQSGEFLVTKDFGEPFQTNMRKCLESAEVEVIMNDRVSNLDVLNTGVLQNQTVKTQNGKEIECNLVLRCVGSRPNTSLTQNILGPESFEKDRVVVNEFLQVKGHSNVYAIGDCTNTKEFKMAAHAGRQGELLAENLLRNLKGRDAKPYQTAFQGMVVTFGTKGGAGVFNGWNLPSFAIGLIKGRTLFTDKEWKMMGQEMP